MIYVEEKDFKRQLQLLAFIAGTHEVNICAWLYPEASICELAGKEVIENPLHLRPVTTYLNGVLPKCTTPTPCSKSAIDSFSAAYSDLKKHCDSLALYKNNNKSWLAATVGHEGMCLVQDQSLLKSLIQAGYAASTKAPNWW